MNFKTVLLAAAALGVAGTAQAADLAKKAPAAANYVKVCDAYGAGFFYIPGSETCLKIGGYVQADYKIFNTKGDFAKGIGWHKRDAHGISTKVESSITLDARTATEMGLLRSFIDLRVSYASAGTATVGLDKAFIQFGGLTAGRASSFFDFYTGYTIGWNEPAHADATVNLLAYTFAFGNGISASLSIEDVSTASSTRRSASSFDMTVAGVKTTYPAMGGVKTPDLVANVKIDQAWGSAQIMAALHQNYGGYYGTPVAAPTVVEYADADKWGYAVGGGVEVNLPMLGAASKLALQAAYAKGAVGYVSPDWGGAATDFTLSSRTSVEQNSAWGVALGLTHGLTKTITASVSGSYAAFDVAQTSSGDFNQVDLTGNVTWAPVKGLAVSAEVDYRRVDYSSTTNAAGTKDADYIVGGIRVKRSF